MTDAVHTGDTNFVGVEDQFKNYAGVDRQPLLGADPTGLITKVKALETYRAVGVPFLGYSYSRVHPASAVGPNDARVRLDERVITAAGMTAQDVITAHP